MKPPDHAAGEVRGLVDVTPNEDLWRAVPNTFGGWALDGSQTPSSVDIVLGGRLKVAAHLGLSRPDVPAHFGDGNAPADCGWTCQVDLAAWPESQVRVQVVVRGRSGRSATIMDRPYVLREDGFAGGIDAPGHDAVVTGKLLQVRGWAVFWQEGPTRVDIELDGRPVGRARIRVPRPDIKGPYAMPAFPFAGFEFCETVEFPQGDRGTVSVAVTDRDGRRHRLPPRSVRRVPLPAEPEWAAALRARTRRALSRVPGHDAAQPPRPGRNLLVFTHRLGLGGGELYLQELLRGIVPALASCTLVSPSDGTLRAELEQLGVDVIVSGRHAPLEPAAYEGQVREMSTLIRYSGCDAVLVNTLAQAPAADAAERLGIPTVWAVHESFDVESWLTVSNGSGGWHPYLAHRMRATLAGASRLLFEAHSTSSLFADDASQQTRVVIPYGIDVDRIATFVENVDRRALRRRLGIPADAIVLLAVGMLEERKSQICMVEALGRVCLQHPNAFLVMVGDAPGGYSDAVRASILASGMSNRVRLVPSTEELWDWYAAADMLVSTSDVESLPRSMLESMAFGVPALAASVFGVPELIEDNRNGWLFPARDMAALTARLGEVLSLDAGSRLNVAQEARSTVLLRHRSDDYGQAFLDLIDDATGDKSHRIAMPAPSPLDVTLGRLDEALDVLAGAARSTGDPRRTQPDGDQRFSKQLEAFNLGAPYVREGIAAFVAEAARQLVPGARIADVGAGDAPYRELFGHADYVTIDWEHSIHPGAPKSDLIASAESLPLDDGSVDAVLMTEVLEHIATPANALAEAARILRPGGRIFLTVPFIWMLHEMPYDYFRYTPSGLRVLLAQAGFEDVTVTSRGNFFTALGQLFQTTPAWLEEHPKLDDLDQRRSLAAGFMTDLADTIASLSPLDTRVLLPLGFNAVARRAAAVPGLGDEAR
jgi:D-inositol-3-phosphate glycosyltransferase